MLHAPKPVSIAREPTAPNAASAGGVLEQVGAREVVSEHGNPPPCSGAERLRDLVVSTGTPWFVQALRWAGARTFPARTLAPGARLGSASLVSARAAHQRR